MKVMLDDGAFMPSRGHDNDAGYDLMTPYDFVLPGANEHGAGTATIETGVHIELPDFSGLILHIGETEIPMHTEAMIISKSGLNTKNNVTSTGLLDEGYRGGIVVKLYNHGAESIHFAKGDKISQFVIRVCLTPELELAKKLSNTERGSDGFGSTGR